jgi:hypothetical protein
VYLSLIPPYLVSLLNFLNAMRFMQRIHYTNRKCRILITREKVVEQLHDSEKEILLVHNNDADTISILVVEP